MFSAFFKAYFVKEGPIISYITVEVTITVKIKSPPSRRNCLNISAPPSATPA